MSTVTLSGEAAAPAASKADLYRVIALAVLAATFGVFIVAFTSEKLLFLYKEQLHLSPGGVGTLGIIAGIPSYLQPFMGAFSDLNPLFGYHRRSYFVLGGVISALGYLFLALQLHYTYGAVIALVMIAAAGGIMVNVVFNAVLVVVGNATGTFGRLQTLLYLISYGWVLVYTGHLTGHVTQDWSYRLAFECAAAFSLAATLLVWLIPEKRRAGQEASAPPEDLIARNAARQEERQRTMVILRRAAASPGLWVLVVFIFYLIVTPGTNTAQVYYEVDALRLSKQFIGNLRGWNAAGVLAALAIYGFGSSRLSARALVFGAWLMDCSAYLLLLNIHNAASAEWVSLLVALSGTIYGLCLYTLAGRACPVGAEGAVYGLVLSAIALGGTLGDKLGGSLYDAFGPSSHHTVTHGWIAMLWFGFGFTVIAAGFIPFLPAWARSGERLSAMPSMPEVEPEPEGSIWPPAPNKS